MSALFFLAIAVIGFFWMAETTITFSPFSFKTEALSKAIGFFLIIIGIAFIENHSEKKGAKKAVDQVIKTLEQYQSTTKTEK